MRKINVLFMQSQDYFGADSLIHSLIMHHFDRQSVTVHAACNYGSPTQKSAALKALEPIPDLHLRPTHFGTSVNFRTRQQIIKDTVMGGLPALASMGSLVQYVKKNRIDIIHGTEKPRDAFYGLVLARLTGARCIVHLHVKVDTWMSPLTRFAMKHADALVGVSAFVARSAAHMGFAPGKTSYVLNSIDASRWDYTLDGTAVRKEFGIAPDMPLLAVVSRLFPWKGHTELLKALAKVKEHVPGFRLLLVGEDDPRATPGKGSYTAELKALTQELGLSEQVIFTGFRSNIPEIMAACDMFTMPSYEEPFGMVYLEAMSMKRPVIALESGGVPEVVEHGKSGLLSPYQDIDQLAANIRTLIEDPQLRVRMGEYGRRRAEEYFNPTRMANDVEQVYRLLLKMSAKQQPHTTTSVSIGHQ